MILDKNSKVLTKRGLLKISEITNDDKIYNGVNFDSIKTLDKLCEMELFTISDYRGKHLIGKNFLIETVNYFNLSYVNVENLTSGNFIISHKSDIFKNVYNYFTLESTNYKYKRVNYIKETYTYPIVVTDEFSYLLGYSWGDGYVTDNLFSLSCSNDYPEIKITLSDIFYKNFSKVPKFYKGDGDLENFKVFGERLCNFFEINNIKKQKAGNLILPKNVLNQSSTKMMAFFCGHFDADGYASGRKKGYCLNSIDLDVIQEYQLFLGLLNIVSTIHTEDRTKQGWRTMYSLTISGESSQYELMKLSTRSFKIQKLNRIAKRDSILSPYNSKKANVKCNRYNFCPDNTQYMSHGCINKLNNDGHNIDTSKVIDTIKIKNTTILECFNIITNSGQLWTNGYVIMEL